MLQAMLAWSKSCNREDQNLRELQSTTNRAARRARESTSPGAGLQALLAWSKSCNREDQNLRELQSTFNRAATHARESKSPACLQRLLHRLPTERESPVSKQPLQHQEKGSKRVEMMQRNDAARQKMMVAKLVHAPCALLQKLHAPLGGHVGCCCCCCCC